jgi:spore maturation protein CgeB
MKILLFSSKSSFTDQFKKALKKRSIKIVEINERSIGFMPFWNDNRFLWHLVRKSTKIKSLSNYFLGRKILAVCEKEKPDIFFATKGTALDSETLSAIRSLGIKTVNWFPENIYHPLYWKWFLKNYQNYDYFFSFISKIVADFSNRARTKFIYMPFAVDPDLYQPGDLTVDDRKKYECDICFVGAMYPEREEILNNLRDLGLNLKIFGWKNWSGSSLAEYYKGPLNIAEMAKVYSLAKISLATNLKPENSGANNRTFEIIAAHGFEISDNQKDLNGLFEIGKEIEVFTDSEDLKRKIFYYLSNERKRKEIISAGYVRLLKDHTFDIRAGQIIDILNQ